MIELLVERFERCLKIGKVANPADGLIDLSAHVNLDAKGMAVQARAAVTRGNIWQPMRCFEAKLFKYFHLTRFSSFHLAQFFYLHLLQV